jgi:hypothetical protein
MDHESWFLYKVKVEEKILKEIPDLPAYILDSFLAKKKYIDIFERYDHMLKKHTLLLGAHENQNYASVH